MYLRVSSFRRFAIYFIDIGLITLVASFILIGVLRLFNFDTARYNALYDSILKNYADFITSGSSKISSQEAMTFPQKIHMSIILNLTICHLKKEYKLKMH